MSHQFPNLPAYLPRMDIPPPAPIKPQLQTSPSGQNLVDEFLKKRGYNATQIQLNSPQLKRNRRKPKKRSNSESLNADSDTEKDVNRQKIHDRIDLWQKKEWEKFARDENRNVKKLKKQLKSAVIRIKESKEMIRKLKKALQGTKQDGSSDEEEIIRKINQLIVIWREALEENRSERDRLKCEIGKDPLNSRADISPQGLWLKCLFGSEDFNVQSVPNSAEFWRIRSEWDSHLSAAEGASQIPFLYNFPPSAKNAGELWSIFKE